MGAADEQDEDANATETNKEVDRKEDWTVFITKLKQEAEDAIHENK